MLAMLAARPLRLKNFTNIALGRHLHMSGDGWLLVIPGEEVKGGRPLEFTLPESLAPFLQVYLERVRPSLLGGKPGDALWLTYQGGPLDSSSVNWRFMLTSKRLIGVHINPHLLRDCAATSLSTVSPAAALAAAALLGHSNFATTERYYIRANQLEAGRRLNSMLSSLKSSLK
jgi:integrase/recombinase XerD